MLGCKHEDDWCSTTSPVLKTTSTSRFTSSTIPVCTHHRCRVNSSQDAVSQSMLVTDSSTALFQGKYVRGSWHATWPRGSAADATTSPCCMHLSTTFRLLMSSSARLISLPTLLAASSSIQTTCDKRTINLGKSHPFVRRENLTISIAISFSGMAGPTSAWFSSRGRRTPSTSSSSNT